MQSETFILDIPKEKSSLVKKLEFEDDSCLLYVYVRYRDEPYIYKGVNWDIFEQMCNAESIGRYYQTFIKPNFKQIKTNHMADVKRPPTKNQASDQKRFIKMKIDVTKINKDWLFSGEKGVYLDFTLQMLPDGQLDQHGNLGMITQDVPKIIYEKEKHLPKEQKTLGPILGNGAEIDWTGGNAEAIPGQQSGNMGGAEDGDLPF